MDVKNKICADFPNRVHLFQQVPQAQGFIKEVFIWFGRVCPACLDAGRAFSLRIYSQIFANAGVVCLSLGMEKEIFIALTFSQEGGAGSVASARPFLFSSQEGRDRFLVSWENEQVSCERTKDAEMSYVGPSGWSYWVELWESTVEI